MEEAMELRLEVKEQAMNGWPGMTHYLVDTSGLPQKIFTNFKMSKQHMRIQKRKGRIVVALDIVKTQNKTMEFICGASQGNPSISGAEGIIYLSDNHW